MRGSLDTAESTSDLMVVRALGHVLAQKKGDNTSAETIPTKSENKRQNLMAARIAELE